MYHSRHSAVKSAYPLRFASGARRRTVACWAKMSPRRQACRRRPATNPQHRRDDQASNMDAIVEARSSGPEHSGGDRTRLSASSLKHEVYRRAVTGLEGSVASPLRRSRNGFSDVVVHSRAAAVDQEDFIGDARLDGRTSGGMHQGVAHAYHPELYTRRRPRRDARKPR